MLMLSRTLLVVRPKRPYVQWANAQEGPKINPNDTSRYSLAFLIDTGDVVPPLADIIDDYGTELFEEMLYGWLTDDESWPRDRGPRAFREWFDVQVIDGVVDVEDGVRLVEEDDDVDPELAMDEDDEDGDEDDIDVDDDEGLEVPPIWCSWCSRLIVDPTTVQSIVVEAPLEADLPDLGPFPLPFPLFASNRKVDAYLEPVESDEDARDEDARDVVMMRFPTCGATCADALRAALDLERQRLPKDDLA